MTDIYIDADACPVKEEILRVSGRHRLTTYFVANNGLRLPQSPLVIMKIVSDGFDAADNWIAEQAGPGDVVITADIPLADRCLKAGARVLGPTGKAFTDANIGNAMAMRELNSQLRDMGEIKGHNASFSPRDRSDFLQALERELQALKRA